MEPHITNSDTEPNPKIKINGFLIAVVILLCIVTFVQGFMLFRIKNDRNGHSPGRAWHARLQKFWPSLADKSHQAALSPEDNQVVFWETTDELEQIHDQINRLLREPPPFLGTAFQRETRNRLPGRPMPEHDLNQLQREIEQIFKDAYNESLPNTLLSRVNRGWDMVSSTAAMNIEDQGSNYVVSVALPGYEKQGITVSMEGHLLIIDAVQQASRTQKAVTRTHAGQFHTQIMMPEDIKGTGVLAAYEQDVLCVHIPKASQTNSLVRSITIR